MSLPLDNQSVITPPSLDARLSGVTLNGDVLESEDSSASSERLQIIDDNKNFTSHLTSQIERWGLHDAGFHYNIVAVFGSQSTGKSTLLNKLFGTTFDVMDEIKRQQTTKGIWMCRGNHTNIMVMDVEGTDGRERGEDQDLERKSALFSLASSEVLLINLWEHQVGLYQGANMGLLKTVFEVNLSLFGKKARDGSQGRTLLLFVIRDHTGFTPLANLQATLIADLNKIWDSLLKPLDLQDRQLSDYFDLAFTALPHKIYAAVKFEAEVQELRKRFVDKDRDDYLFKPAYHKGIPADGVAFYMENIWEKIQMNKDLDIPTQQELLAQFRCDEIYSVTLAEFTEQLKPQLRLIEAGHIVEGLGGLMRNWRTQAFDRYDRDASRYHKGVYKLKRADLPGVLNSALFRLFLEQLKNLHKSCIAALKTKLLDIDEGNFADISGKARTKIETQFADGAKDALLENTDWTWERELGLLREEIGNVIDQCREDAKKKAHVVTLSPFFDGRLRDLHKSCLSTFEMELRIGLHGKTYNFAEAVNGAQTRCEAQFVEGAKKALLAETDWTWNDELESLRKDIGDVVAQCLKGEKKKWMHTVLTALKPVLGVLVFLASILSYLFR